MNFYNLKGVKNNECQKLKDSKFIEFTDLFKFSKNGFILLLLCIVPFLLFWQTTSFEFVWDDTDHLMNNKYLNPASLKNLSHFWKEVHWGLYIPITYTIWGGIKEFSLLLGFNPESTFLFHFANNLLHIINGLLVFTILRQLIHNRWYAMIGALFFLTHPIQVETVAWVSEFRGLLSFTFGFTALYLYIKSCHYNFQEHHFKLSRRYYVYSWFFFIAALLSKPSILVIFIFILIFEYYLYQTTIKKLFLRVIPFLLPILITIAITSSVQGNTTDPYPLWIRPFIYSDSVIFYLKKVFIPFDFSITYGRNNEYLITHWWFYSSWLLLLGIGLILLKYRKKLKLILLGAILFIVGFLTVSGLIRFDFQGWSNVADRYAYISMVGMAIIISASLEILNINKKGIFLFLTILIGCLIFLAAIQIPIWRDRLSLWDNAIKITPQESEAWNQRGIYYSKHKQYKKALLDYQKSVELNPKNDKPYYNMGILLCRLKKYDLAIRAYDQSLILSPLSENYYYNRGLTYLNLKKYDLAISDFKKAIQIKPEYKDAIINLNIALRFKQKR